MKLDNHEKIALGVIGAFLALGGYSLYKHKQATAAIALANAKTDVNPDVMANVGTGADNNGYGYNNQYSNPYVNPYTNPYGQPAIQYPNYGTSVSPCYSPISGVIYSGAGGMQRPLSLPGTSQRALAWIACGRYFRANYPNLAPGDPSNAAMEISYAQYIAIRNNPVG